MRQSIPAGFLPDQWNAALSAVERLAQQLAHMQAMLAECADCTPENSDLAFVREQIQSEVDTLQHMAGVAERRWQAVSIDVATAAGRFGLSRPADDVAWYPAMLNAAWRLYNGLQRELAGVDSAACVRRLPLHLGRIPDDIATWQDRITAELRGGKLTSTAQPAGPVEYSKALRVSTWHQHFLAARFSENTSERFFRDWLNNQIRAGVAVRDSERGPVRFAIAFLQRNGIEPPT